jgi:hypothetical protein
MSSSTPTTTDTGVKLKVHKLTGIVGVGGPVSEEVLADLPNEYWWVLEVTEAQAAAAARGLAAEEPIYAAEVTDR